MTCLRSVMDGYMLPRVIVTDRELALMNAYDTAFPNAKGLLDDDLGCQVKVEVENFNKEFKKQSRAGKKSLLRKMKEITTPSETSLNELATQKATGGRSSFKRAPADQPSQMQEPARYNFSSMPSFVGKDDFMNQKPRSLAYIDQFSSSMTYVPLRSSLPLCCMDYSVLGADKLLQSTASLKLVKS
ncbi:hypothetical protein Tco_1389536 [Tanacetum coccineum]